jgi:hypothetical protein
VTAKELIAHLQALPPETPVLVEGYETGFDDIVELTPEQVVRYRHAQEWDGEYQAPDRFSNPEIGVRQAAVIRGRRGPRRQGDEG